MVAKILETCINCDICEPQCPNQAISFNGSTYIVEPSLCNECEDIYPKPTCINVCPISCIILVADPK